MVRGRFTSRTLPSRLYSIVSVFAPRSFIGAGTYHIDVGGTLLPAAPSLRCAETRTPPHTDPPCTPGATISVHTFHSHHLLRSGIFDPKNRRVHGDYSE